MQRLSTTYGILSFLLSSFLLNARRLLSLFLCRSRLSHLTSSSSFFLKTDLCPEPWKWTRGQDLAYLAICFKVRHSQVPSVVLGDHSSSWECSTIMLEHSPFFLFLPGLYLGQIHSFPLIYPSLSSCLILTIASRGHGTVFKSLA